MNRKPLYLNILAGLLCIALAVFVTIVCVDQWKDFFEHRELLARNPSLSTLRFLMIVMCVLQSVNALLLLIAAIYLLMDRLPQAGVMLILFGSSYILEALICEVSYYIVYEDSYLEGLKEYRYIASVLSVLVFYSASIATGVCLRVFDRTGRAGRWLNGTIVTSGALILMLTVLDSSRARFGASLGFQKLTTAYIIVYVCAQITIGVYVFMLSKQPSTGARPAMYGVPAANANSYAPFNRDLQNGMVRYGVPQQTYGQPGQSFGQMHQGYGQPGMSAGAMQQAYGQPQQAYSQPQQTYGQPQQAYSQPQQTYDQPQQADSQPQQIDDMAQQMFDQIQQGYDQPAQSADPVQPENDPSI